MASRAVDCYCRMTQFFISARPRIPPNSQAVDVLQRGALGDDNPGHLRADINTSGLPVGVMGYLRSTVYDITYTGINKPNRSAKNWKTVCAKAMTCDDATPR